MFLKFNPMYNENHYGTGEPPS